MTDEIISEEPKEETVDLVAQELKVLKARADLINLKYHPSIGLAKLKAKLEAKLAEKPARKDPEEAKAPIFARKVDGNTIVHMNTGESVKKRNMRLRKESSRLIRVNITCMNPAKKSWEGEIFTASNSVIGTIKKYVLFNTTEGFHVPKLILNMIEEKQFQLFYTEKTPRGEVKKSKLAKEFVIEKLPALTGYEIQELAKKQAMANNLD